MSQSVTVVRFASLNTSRFSRPETSFVRTHLAGELVQLDIMKGLNHPNIATRSQSWPRSWTNGGTAGSNWKLCSICFSYKFSSVSCFWHSDILTWPADSSFSADNFRSFLDKGRIGKALCRVNPPDKELKNSSKILSWFWMYMWLGLKLGCPKIPWLETLFSHCLMINDQNLGGSIPYFWPHEFPLWSSICRWTKINPGNHHFFLERILQTPKWMAGSLLDGRINSKSHPNAIWLISMISPRNAWFHPMWLGYLSAECWVPSDNQSHGLGSYAKAQSVR